MTLPPGQYAVDRLPRFGMSQFAGRFPRDATRISLQIAGETEQAISVEDEFDRLPRIELISDFHCVTTWTCRSLRWSGVRFADFFTLLVAPKARPHGDATFVVLRGQDGYRAALPLDDLLGDDVLLADTLDGRPLTVQHGAPLRLVAPAHYGYKSVKHLSRIELWRDDRYYRSAGFRFMDHPRARVAQEERGKGIPGWLLRYLYRPLVRPTIARFQAAMESFERDAG